MTMQVVFCDPSADAESWVASLRRHLPAAQVDSWIDGAAAADYAVAWAPPQAFIDQQTRLKALFNVGAGVDKLLALKLPPHLTIIRLDDAGMGVQMAEYVCHAVIRHFREFVQYEAQAAQGVWERRKPHARSAFVVGIQGMGVLGQRVASALRHFEFPVNGWSRSHRSVDGVTGYAGLDQLPQFLARSKAVVCLLPLTPDTRNILSRQTLAQLPTGAYVVNVARGDHLVDEDLLALLDSGHLAGATLDVFRTEPLPGGHTFWRHPKIRVTPHTSAQTLLEDSIAQIADKILAFDRGAEIAGRVDAARGY